MKKFEGDSDFFLKLRAQSDACEDTAAYARAEALHNCCKVHRKSTSQLQMKAGLNRLTMRIPIIAFYIWKTEVLEDFKKIRSFYDRVTKLQYTFPGSRISCNRYQYAVLTDEHSSETEIGIEKVFIK